MIDKPGTTVDPTATIELEPQPPYVSRGGEKLAKALQTFPLTVADKICLDGGISTGGFTDCLLQAGAKQVYGVDVGYGQVAWSLRTDPRVILRERTNLRYLTPLQLYGSSEPLAQFGVADVSFISLTKVLPALWTLLAPPKTVVLLVKPQFEVGKAQVGKRGVVRSPSVQAEAVAQVLETSYSLGWHYQGLTWSPLVGPAGNIEYLLWLDTQTATTPPDLAAINQITLAAAGVLISSD